VLVERRGAILLLILNRPQAVNAFDRAQAEALAAALDLLDDDRDLRAAVITGAGNRFCAGTDLRAARAGESVEVGSRGYYGMLARPPRKPVVAAVEGVAMGGGCELMLACDLTVAGRSTRFGLPEVKRGVIAAGGALARLPRRIPYHVAMDLLLTGRDFGAEEAARLGWVARVVEDGDALEAALGLAGEIAANGPLAVELTKQGIVESVAAAEPEDWKRSRALVRRIVESEDFREGVDAFFEKRPPRWTGA
jgi:enoyl-CoA hydratase